MAVVLHNGALAAGAAGAWVAITASTLYVAQSVGYSTVEFSLDGVNEFKASVQVLDTTVSNVPDQNTWRIVNLPAVFARARSTLGVNQAAVKLMIQET